MSGSTASIAIAAMAAPSLVLMAMFLVASGLSGWYEERARRGLAAVKRGAGLRAGFGAIQGTARPLDGRGGGRLVTSTHTQWQTSAGRWRDEAQITRGAPFLLVVESGEEIEVDPDGARLEGLASSEQGRPVRQGAAMRELVMRLSAGDEVWATGVLSRRAAPRAGAYRSGVERRRLQAPRRGQVEISAESPLPKWRRLAAAHRASALTAIVLGVLLHAVVYRAVDVALLERDQAKYGVILDDHRYLPVLMGSGLLALAIAGVGWRNRAQRAGTDPAQRAQRR